MGDRLGTQVVAGSNARYLPDTARVQVPLMCCAQPFEGRVVSSRVRQ
jgi:hypothetical protein